MVAWLDAEALAATLATGEVHFHSRSRGRLWRKGETSGNVLHLRSLAVDCDGDALLIGVEPHGPTCHRGERSCFDADGSAVAPPQGFAWLESLWTTIAERAADRPDGTYTVALLDGGVDVAGRKVPRRRPRSCSRPRTTSGRRAGAIEVTRRCSRARPATSCTTRSAARARGLAPRGHRRPTTPPPRPALCVRRRQRIGNRCSTPSSIG
jgi:hypothetical protein